MVPFSQYKILSPYRKFQEFQTDLSVYTESNLLEINLSGNKHFYTTLEKNEMLYIPAYYFKQYRITSDIGISLNFQFNSHSRMLDNMMKTLIQDIKIKKD